MQAGKNQAGTIPTAFGSMLQASTYGMTIPNIYGRTLAPMLAIWANNLRQGGSTKKFKQLKKGVTAYCENIDFLIGANPILNVLQFWNNSTKLPLEFVSFNTSGAGRLKVGNFSGSPDPNFYAVIGVTISGTYSTTFNDYGSAGSSSVSGNWEVPLWNELMTGPDAVHGSAVRNFPYCYRWEPSYGAYIYIDSGNFFTETVTIYYARTTSATSYQSPAAKLRLSFENVLGSGDEFNDYPGERILYPAFAGLGSPDYDLGSTGAIPAVKPETQGRFGLYSTGDCDFVDIIEDVLKSGIQQAGIGASESYSAMQSGLALSDYPGCVQIRFNTSIEQYTVGPQSYNLPVTVGNFLVVIAQTLGVGGSTFAITDTAGNTWTQVMAQPGGSGGYAVWWAQANASGPVTVTVSNLGYGWTTTLIEIAGVDSFDTSATATGNAVSVASSTVVDYPAYLLAIGCYAPGTFTPLQIPAWNLLSKPSMYNDGVLQGSIYERVVRAPGEYPITMQATHSEAICILAFKCAQPPSYPRPQVNVFDYDSAELTRRQCRTNGLWGSLAMTAQKPASEWINDLTAAANCAPVWSGFKLKLIPRSEVSAAGNGVIYTSPTAAGPVADLDADKGDFIGTTPIQVIRKARTDLTSVMQMQHINRDSDYQQIVTVEPDAASIALYGVRKADPVVNNAVHDVGVARSLMRIATRRRNYVDPLSYKFQMNARWQHLEAMDLITITDRSQGIVKVPVRLISTEEDDKFAISAEAEPFIYGIHAPQSLPVTNPSPYRPGIDTSVGSGVNPPIIFEATPRLAQQTSPAQIWCAVSCSDPNYGGCLPYVSTDGGLSYHPISISPVMGSAAMGVCDLDFASHSDPDTANDLQVNLGQSLATLASYSDVERDKFQFPAYVGWPTTATAQAIFTAGDTSQITKVGALFSNPLVPSLPSDAAIVNIFPMIGLAGAPVDPTATSKAYDGTSMTATSGGTIMGSGAGIVYDAAGLGSSLSALTGAQIRYEFGLPTTGGSLSVGSASMVAWAILYSSATPLPLDGNYTPPFIDVGGRSWAFAIPQTVSTGTVGTGTNATITAAPALPPAGINYEIITYNQAALVSANIWKISGTGSGNEIRRGVDGAPSPGMGMDHPKGSPFAMLLPDGTGIVKVNMDPAWIGVQLWFKFLTFNTFGSVLQPLADADAYPFTPTGIPGNIGPSQSFLVNGS